MAIFMPLDNNLNFNNILKFQTPTQIFQQLLHKEESEENFMSNSNFFGNSNAKVHDISRMMSDKKHKSLSFHLDVINNHDESCNSTDSDLSVGQEKIDDDKSDNNNDQNELETVEKPASRNVLGDEEEDNSSNASSSRHTSNSTHLRNPQSSTEISENAIQMSILRPNPSRMQEDIFRNSQLYAEELVRQQLAAAARLQSLTAAKIFPHIDPSAFNETQRLVLSSHPESVDPSLTSKLNFQSCVFTPKTNDNNQNGNNLFCNNKSAINFQNIHSHLSAISQITNNLTSNIKKDDSTSLSSLSRESSQSPSNFQHLKQHHHQNMIFHTHQNQLHERNLKFSIDNILKADFGRRITEPLLRSSKSRKALREGKPEKESFKKFSAPASMKEAFASRDENPRVPESSPSNQSSPTSTEQSKGESGSKSSGSGSGTVWPAWVFCTRYSDRPSSGPRVKRPKKPPSDSSVKSEDEKRPRTAFSGPQLARLKHEFNENRYLTEKRRQQLSGELGLNEAQIKIWFQNKRAKIKKSTGQKNPLALQLMAQGLYNHSTVPLSKEEEELQELQAAN